MSIAGRKPITKGRFSRKFGNKALALINSLYYNGCIFNFCYVITFFCFYKGIFCLIQFGFCNVFIFVKFPNSSSDRSWSRIGHGYAQASSHLLLTQVLSLGVEAGRGAVKEKGGEVSSWVGTCVNGVTHHYSFRPRPEYCGQKHFLSYAYFNEIFWHVNSVRL